MERILNKGKKSRILSAVAAILAALMAITLLPISTKAEEVPETIHLSNAILAQAKSNPNTPMNGIEYFPASEEGAEGNGIYGLYEAATYILDENITLDGEVLLFRVDSDPDKPYETVTLDLNGFTLDHTNYLRKEIPVSDDDYDEEDDYKEYYYYGVVTCANCRLVVKDSSAASTGTIDTTKVPKTDSIVTDPKCVALLAYGSVEIESGIFKGRIKTADANEYSDTDYDVDSLFNITINGGCFDDIVLSDIKTTINNGTFNRTVYLDYDTVINGGVFNQALCSNDDLIINDGAFNYKVELDSDDGLAVVEINDGHFEGAPIYFEDPVIDVRNVQLTINDIYVKNLREDEYGYINALYALPDLNHPSSVIINGGTFIGGNVSDAVVFDDVGYAEINGGEFIGHDGGLTIFSDDSPNIPNVVLSGGRYRAYGTLEDNIQAGITYVFHKDLAKESYGNDALDFLLAEGYYYSPAQQITYEEGSKNDLLFTEDFVEIKALPAVKNDEGNTSLTEAMQDIIKEILHGETPVGVSPELAQAIAQAASDGLDIGVAMSITPISKDDVKEDAAKVDATLNAKETVVGFYDIKVGVSIDGEFKGYITKFNDGVLIKLPVPENLPAVARGYERVFSLIRVHDGVATKLPAQVVDGYINSYSDSYSTYALVYEDVSATPQTGDSGVTAWIVLASGFLAVGVLIAIYKNKKEISE